MWLHKIYYKGRIIHVRQDSAFSACTICSLNTVSSSSTLQFRFYQQDMNAVNITRGDIIQTQVEVSPVLLQPPIVCVAPCSPIELSIFLE